MNLSVVSRALWQVKGSRRLSSVFDVDRLHPVGRWKFGSVALGKRFPDPEATALLQHGSAMMHCL